MTNSNQKGKRGERELAKELTSLFGVQCRRGQQYNGLDGQDVVGIPGLHIECKRTETLSVYKAVEQAKEDAKDGEIPIVCHRRNGQKWLAIVELNSLPALAERIIKEPGE